MATENEVNPPLDPNGDGPVKIESDDDVNMDPPDIEHSDSRRGHEQDDQQPDEQPDISEQDDQQPGITQPDEPKTVSKKRKQNGDKHKEDGTDGTESKQSASFTLFKVKPVQVGDGTGRSTGISFGNGNIRPTIEQGLKPRSKPSNFEPAPYSNTYSLCHRISDCHDTVGWLKYGKTTWFLNQYGLKSNAWYRFELHAKSKEYEMNPPKEGNLKRLQPADKKDEETNDYRFEPEDFNDVSAVAWFVNWEKIDRPTDLKDQIRQELQQINPDNLEDGEVLPTIYARGVWHVPIDKQGTRYSAWETKSKLKRVFKGKDKGRYAMYNRACYFAKEYFKQLDDPDNRSGFVNRTPEPTAIFDDEDFGRERRGVSFDFDNESSERSNRRKSKSRSGSSDPRRSGSGRPPSKTSKSRSKERRGSNASVGSQYSKSSDSSVNSDSESEWSGSDNEYINNGVYADSSSNTRQGRSGKLQSGKLQSGKRQSGKRQSGRHQSERRRSKSSSSSRYTDDDESEYMSEGQKVQVAVHKLLVELEKSNQRLQSVEWEIAELKKQTRTAMNPRRRRR
ncbi:hypothetical protein Purlil1_12429 [Purpureocillium lilacinum]|uniref:Uncharacterized protein n=1 Tax=Purpureocillium lilacinum TaxID=33203 RepID=A0ABR0BH21_PURLI|nr:hypothetical protein Purlil1_12429 [Purpureocillium lilacinum]